MKLYFLLILLITVAEFSCASAKNHRGGKHRAKKAAVTPQSSDVYSAEHLETDHDSPVHEITNKKTQRESRKRDNIHDSVMKKSSSNKASSSGPNKNTRDLGAATQMASLHEHVIEHNINRKQLDYQTGIQMEQEQLIHATPQPLKVTKKSSPLQKKRNKMRNARTKQTESKGTKKTTSKKTKKNNKKVPKKYNSKTHGWKKMQKKEKKDKLKEKREKQIKRLRALKNAKRSAA